MMPRIAGHLNLVGLATAALLPIVISVLGALVLDIYTAVTRDHSAGASSVSISWGFIGASIGTGASIITLAIYLFNSLLKSGKASKEFHRRARLLFLALFLIVGTIAYVVQCQNVSDVDYYVTSHEITVVALVSILIGLAAGGFALNIWMIRLGLMPSEEIP